FGLVRRPPVHFLGAIVPRPHSIVCIAHHYRVLGKFDELRLLVQLGLFPFELFLGAMNLINVYQNDYGAVDLVIDRAIGMYAHHVPAPFPVADLAFDRLDMIDYLADDLVQVGHNRIEIDVADRPANVGGQQIHHFSGGSSHTSNAQIPADHDYRDTGTG